MSAAKKLIGVAFLIGLAFAQVSGWRPVRGGRPDGAGADVRARRVKERDRYADRARKLQEEGQLPQAIAAAEQALIIEKEVFGERSREVADSLAYLAELHEQRQDFGEAVKWRQQVLDTLPGVPGLKGWETTDAILALANARSLAEKDAGELRCLDEARRLSRKVRDLSRQGRFREALGPARRALRIRREFLLESHPNYAQGLSDLASLYHDLGDYVRSRRLFEKALATWKDILGTNHPHYAVALVNVGVLHERSQEYVEAAKYYREARDIRKKLLGPKHPAYLRSMKDLANALAGQAGQDYRSGDFEAARRADAELLAVRTEVLGAKHWEVVNARLDVEHVSGLLGMGGVKRQRFLEGEHLTWKALKLEEMEKYPEARELLRKTFDIWKEIAGGENRSYADGLRRLGMLEARQGNFRAAEQSFRRARRIQERLLGKTHPDYAETLFVLAASRSARGDHEEALALLWEVEAIRKATLGEADAKYPQTVERLASVYAEQAAAYEAEGRFEEARKPRRKVVELRRALLEGQKFAIREGLVRGPEGYGIKRWPLTDARLSLAHLELLRTLDGAGRRQLAEADGLVRTAEKLARDGKTDEAVAAAEKARAVRKEVLGDHHRAYADCLALSGRLRQDKGDLADAQKLLREAARVRKVVLGEDHPDYRAALDALSGLDAEAAEKCKKRGDYPGARLAFEEALTVETELHGPDHWRVKDVRRSIDYVERLARMTPDQRRRLVRTAQTQQKVRALKEQGDYRGALEPAGEVRKDLRDLLGEDNRRYATALNNLGFLYEAVGEYGRAGPLYQQALELRRTILGEKHPDYAASLHNLGALASNLGESDRAEALFQHALRIRTEALGEEDEDRAATLNSLGTLYLDRHRYADAEPLLIEALRIRRHLLGEDDPAYARTLNSLAGLYARGVGGPRRPADPRAGGRDLAELLYREASGIWKARGGKAREALGDYARSLDNLARLHHDRGDYAGAEKLYLEAQANFREILGPAHRDYAISLHGLAVVYQAMDPPRDALGMIDQAMRIDQSNLRQVFAFSSEPGMKAYLDGLGVLRPLDGLVSMAQAEGAEGSAVNTAFIWALRRKGLVLDALSQFRDLQALLAQDDAVAGLVRRWRERRQRLADWRVKPPPGTDEERLRQLEKEVNVLEAELHRTLSERRPGHFSDPAGIDIDQVRRRLREGAALVEVVRIHPYDFRAKGGASPWGPARYFAFVLTSEPEARPRLVPLGGAGEAEEIDEQIRRLCDPLGTKAKESRQFLDDLRQAGEKTLEDKFRQDSGVLYKQLFAPLRPALGRATLVYLSLDGELNRLPFEALVDGDGKYLIETYRFAYLSSGRDLLRAPPGEPGRGTIVFAGPDFGAPAAERRHEAHKQLKELKSKNSDYAPPKPRPARGGEDRCLPTPKGGEGYLALTATKEYLQVLREALRDSAFAPVTTYRGETALEEVFKALPPPRVLHVNTHGLFSPGQAAGVDEEDTGAPTVWQGQERLSRVADPMFRSAFVLAGANRLADEDAAAAGAEDGFVTAEEVAMLNFQGTDLVFLDACLTGVGDVRLGEGIYGLRRAFLYAGTRTLVNSLFEVPYVEHRAEGGEVYETRELMRQFYGRLKEGKGKLEALHEAQLEIIRRRKARNGAAHPFFWAGFVLVGDPG